MLEPSSPRTFLAKTGPRRSGVSLERDVSLFYSWSVHELTPCAVGGTHLEASISNPSPAFQATSFLPKHRKVRIATLILMLCNSYHSLAIVHPPLAALLGCRGA